MSPIRKSPTVYPYRGKWRLKYVDASGKDRTRTADSKQSAYALLVEMGYLNAQGRTLHATHSDMTVGQWLDIWIRQHSTELRPKTLANNVSLIRNHIEPSLGATNLADLNIARIESTYNNLHHSKSLAPSSIHRIHAVLSVALKGAVRYGLIPSNPCDGVRKPKMAPKRPQTLSAGQVASVLERALERGPECHLRWLLALRYGLRQAEALALKFSDFSLESCTLHIGKQMQRFRGVGFIETPPKSEKGVRDIPISTEICELLARIQEGRNPDSLVFPGPTGRPRHSSFDRMEWLRILSEVGIAPLPLHSARHTAATEMIQAGVNVRAVQLVLGHSTPSFTLATYVHPSLEQLRSELEKLD